MSRDSESTFTRRALLLSGAGGAVFAGLGARLFTLQVQQSERYQTLSEDNQFNYRLLPPPRGRITDRFGDLIADNRDAYNVLMVPDQTGGVEKTLERLRGLIGLSDEEIERVLRDVSRSPSFRPVRVAENLDWDVFARLNIHAPDLPGVLPVAGELRFYPHPHAFAHVTGYVGKANEEMAGDDPLLRHPGFKVGRDGLELSQDERLRGEAGALKIEVDAFGRVVRELPDPRTRPVPGEDLRLTLDMGLQRYAHERLGQEAASAVVMDTVTGDVLALVSAPSYDPNHFARGMSQAEYDTLRADPRNPLFKKPVAGLFPPASTFKMLVAMAAQRHGLNEPSERIFCPGRMRLGNRTFHCWRRSGHGAVNMREAIQRSCDVYFYETARRLGIERISETAREFGLGEMFEIGIPGTEDGLVPDPQWKRTRRDAPWTTGDTFNTGIGQGFLQTSPLQLAVMSSRLASGRRVMPRLIREGRNPIFDPLPYSPKAFAVIRDAMMSVCEEPRGTAHYALEGGFNLGDVLMAGKTGTAQVVSLSNQKNADGTIPWDRRHHGLFVAFAPYDRPRYACAVVIEHGGGGTVAAPYARDILRMAVQRDSGNTQAPLASLDSLMKTQERET